MEGLVLDRCHASTFTAAPFIRAFRSIRVRCVELVSILAMRCCGAVMSFLRDTIAHVVALCSQEQMIRSNTVTHVAVMTNGEAKRDPTVRDLPRVAMSTDSLIAYRKQAIAVRPDGASPDPACVSFCNSCPEAVGIVSARTVRAWHRAVLPVSLSNLVGMCRERSAAGEASAMNHQQSLASVSGYCDGGE